MDSGEKILFHNPHRYGKSHDQKVAERERLHRIWKGMNPNTDAAKRLNGRIQQLTNEILGGADE